MRAARHVLVTDTNQEEKYIVRNSTRACIATLVAAGAVAVSPAAALAVNHPVRVGAYCNGGEIQQKSSYVSLKLSKPGASMTVKLWFTGSTFDDLTNTTCSGSHGRYAAWRSGYARLWTTHNGGGLFNSQVRVGRPQFWNRPQINGRFWSFAQAYVDVIATSRTCINVDYKNVSTKVCTGRNQSVRLYANVSPSGSITSGLEQ